VGDEVYFAGNSARDGAYAEYVAIDERIVGKKPKNLSFVEAACEPLTVVTAFEALEESLDIPELSEIPEKPKSILITAGAGGVGTIAIQISKKLLKLRTIATASREESAKVCRELGADDIINHYQELKGQIEALGLQGVDYILNCGDVDNKKFNELLALLNPFGKICFVAGSNEPVSLNLFGIMSKRIQISGELMYTRSIFDLEPERQGIILNRAANLLDEGFLKSRMTKTYDFFTQIQQAHKDLESGRTIGKIGLKLNP